MSKPNYVVGMTMAVIMLPFVALLMAVIELLASGVRWLGHAHRTLKS